MQQLTIEDLRLINLLSSRKYPKKSLKPHASEGEIVRYKEVKDKLKSISQYFSDKYSSEYGPFITSVAPERNDINRGGKLLNVWSTFFKGSYNKQYSAQISFVIEQGSPYLNVGFYFGRASYRGSGSEKEALESTLNKIGKELSDVVTNNKNYYDEYNSLFDLGFIAYSNGIKTPDNWLNSIKNSPENSQITVKIHPNELGVIENSILDFYISKIIFLMSTINYVNSANLKISPPTPEQCAKRAERNILIGIKGEEYILAYEQKRLTDLGISKNGYPKHVALESTHYGFDILSLDNTGKDIFIEVKTTTRLKEDIHSKKFYITNNELNILNENKSNYILRRVYDIENQPNFEDLDLSETTREANGYIVKY